MNGNPNQIWARLNLTQRFAVASFAVLVAGMLAIGWWVSEEIEHGVVQNSAATTALYINSVIAPVVLELEDRPRLSSGNVAALRYLRSETPLADRIVSLKIWGPDGLVVYSNLPGVSGRRFPIGEELRTAWDGKVAAELSDLEDEESRLERRASRRLLEIYSPIRSKSGDRVIAVAEFYARADDLEQQLFVARSRSWLVVAAVTLAMFALLFGIVRGGSRTIASQQRELERNVSDLSQLLKQNAELHNRVRRANNRALAINERFLRRVSAELHDGPAQALGFALLRLDSVLKSIAPGARTGTHDRSAASPAEGWTGADVEAIRGALEEALREIRNLSSGLAMPEIEGMTLQQSLQRLLRTHERRTGTRVAAQFGDLPEQLPLAAKIGVYRFVQEALNNASRHGGGLDQRVSARVEGPGLQVTVSDAGPGFEADGAGADGEGLGLVGMRERIESLGGRLEIRSRPGEGTRLTATLGIREEESSGER